MFHKNHAWQKGAMNVPPLPPFTPPPPFAALDPQWTEFLTHACENITFPQLLLQTVTIGFSFL